MYTKLIIIISLFILFSLVQCQESDIVDNKNGQNIDHNNSTKKILRNVHLNYFGYFASSATNNKHHIGVDSTPEILDHVNIIWISERDLAKRFQSVRQANANGANLHVVFSPYWTIFERGLTLHANYEERWDDLTKLLDNYLDLIIAFYPVDEPYLRGKKFTKPPVNDTKVDKILTDVISLIKKRYPGKSIWMIFSYTQIYEGKYIPDLFDAVGVDCYGGFNNCGKITSKKSIPNLYNILMNSVSNNTKLLIVPEVFKKSRENRRVSIKYQNNLIDNLDNYYAYAQHNKRVIGFIPFLWQSYFPSKNKIILGAKNMPLVQEHLKIISKNIIGHPENQSQRKKGT